MNKNLLVTFGCSWTYGVGIDYKHGMLKKDYLKVNQNTDTANSKSFRGIIANDLQFDNRNFSKGASSNTAQFRKAELYFTSQEFLNHQYDRVVVLWGITSLSRTELFSIQNNSMLDVFYNKNDTNYGKTYLREHYDTNNELRLLSNQINHWNHYFELLGVENYWFDTFNHHDYPMYSYDNLDQTSYTSMSGNDWPTYDYYKENINSKTVEAINQEMFNMGCGKSIEKFNDTFLFFNDKPRDLLSKLCYYNDVQEFDDQYHNSDWSSDTIRIDRLVEKNVLNPISFHPTQLGHKQIAEIIIDSKILQR